MQCLSCGTIIQSAATTCPSCGTLVRTFDATSYDAEPIPYMPYSPLLPPSSASTVSSPLPTEAEAHVLPQAQPVQEKPQQRPQILRATAVLLIILALVFVGSGGGLVAYATIFHPAELRAQATAVTQNIVTEQAQASSTQSLQNTYNQITNTRPSLSDSLDGQQSSLWVNKGQPTTGCAFTRGAYHIHIAPKDFYVYCLATGRIYSNFIFQTHVTIIKGLEAGIAFRAPNQSLSFYDFSITHTGLYSLSITGSQFITLVAFGRSSAINIGLNQSNLVTVMAHNTTISLFINKQFVKSIRDTTYSSGTVGLVATNLPRTTVDVAFSNVQIWNVP